MFVKEEQQRAAPVDEDEKRVFGSSLLEREEARSCIDVVEERLYEGWCL